jgi:hypothetical protein
MPIDARIPLGITGPDPNSFTNALAAGMKMRELRNTADRQAAKDEQAERKTNTLAGYGASPRGPEDRAAVWAVDPASGMALDKAAAEGEKNTTEAAYNKVRTDKLTAEATTKKLAVIGQILNGVTDEPTYQQARAQVLEIEPNAQKWPEGYDPAFVEITKRRALGVGEQLKIKLAEDKANAPPEAVRNSFTGEWEFPPARPGGGQPPATGAGPEPAPPGAQGSPNLTQTEDPTHRYFKNRYGLSDAGAFALSRNITQESGHRTDVKGDGGKAQGLAQWHPDRWAKLENWAQENGLDANSKQAQMDYIMEEAKSYPGYEALKGNDPEAIRAFVKNYEGYGVEGARFAGLDERAAQGGGAPPPTDVPPASPPDGQPAPVDGPQTPPPPQTPPLVGGGPPRSPSEAAWASAQRQDANAKESQRIARERVELEKRRVTALEARRGGTAAEGREHTQRLKNEQKFRDFEANMTALTDAAGNLDADIVAKGTETDIPVVGSAGAAAQSTLYADVMSGIQRIRDMGVLQPGEFPFLEMAVKNPTTFMNAARAGDIRGQLAVIKQQAGQALERARTRFAVPAAGATPHPDASPAPPKPVKVAPVGEFDAMPMPGEWKGKGTLTDTKTGIRYRSDGRNWIKQ